MKTKIILPLIAIIFLSSCADKFSLTKRKYTKGYYFASSKSKSTTKNENEHKNLTVKNLPAKNTILNVESNANPEIINTTNTTISAFVKSNSSATIANGKKQTANTAIASNNTKTNFVAKTSVKPLVEKRNFDLNQIKKGSGDTDLIIQIILCFLWWFNLLAVYLHDGKKITLNFWITLLLDFTFIGGVIFSLLVVLDIIDLK